MGENVLSGTWLNLEEDMIITCVLSGPKDFEIKKNRAKLPLVLVY